MIAAPGASAEAAAIQAAIEILDINTGLPVACDTMANGTRSAAIVQKDEELQDALTEAHPAQTERSEVVPDRVEEEYEFLDL